VIEGATPGRICGQLVRGVSKRRWVRLVTEAGYDAVAWTVGLLTVARATSELAGTHMTTVALGVRVAGICAVAAGCGFLAGLYRGRYLRGSRDEVTAVALAGLLTTCCVAVIGLALVPRQRALLGTVLGGAAFAVVAMLGARYAVFAARLRSRPAAPTAVKIIVFGAGDAGTQLIHRLATQSGAAYRPVAILDDDPAKRRLRIDGVPVLGGRGQMTEVAANSGARVLVIAIAGRSGRVIHDLTEAAERCGLVPKVIPSVRELLTGGARIEGVRDPRISDLLGRPAAATDVASVRERIAGKRVLVTGAGGSIGAELCRQLHRLGPAELIMLDRDESALHAVQLALNGRALLDSEETVLADIRDQRRIREVFGRFRPDIVFHAAALKHLPLLESYPAEALKSNVWGTVTVLEAAADHGVQSFVNISTDKAANPVSVLGYSKRIAERLTAYMSAKTGAAYLSVRFGNVLGSRGSVLTALSAQVAAGGPLTVTHPDVRRYFMLAEEAVHLVLQATAIGRGGEVLVLDMGEPVRITDMARRLTASAGRDVDIVFTGLRPGEKLTEDRLGAGETDQRPCHPLICQVPVPALNPREVTALDPDADAHSLRQALARYAYGDSGDGTAAVPLPDRAGTLPAQEAGPRLAGWPRSARLRTRSSMRPAKLSQPRHQPLQQAGGIRIGAPRSACRVGHVVLGGVAKQQHALASRMSTRQPAGERLAGGARPDPLTAPDEFLERERTRPCPGCGGHGIPEIFPGHRQHESGPGQVRGAGDAAAVRGGLDPVRGHDRDDFGVRRVSAAEHPGRAHRHGHAERGQPPGEQRGRHRGPAYVRRAQHENAGLGRGIPLRCRNMRDTIFVIHLDITKSCFSSAFHAGSRNFPQLSTVPGLGRDFISAALGVHSFLTTHAGRQAPLGLRGLATATCISERK
jgi:FlaA1/EpsC-like NDP-sugar epimerase